MAEHENRIKYTMRDSETSLNLTINNYVNPHMIMYISRWCYINAVLCRVIIPSKHMQRGIDHQSNDDTLTPGRLI